MARIGTRRIELMERGEYAIGADDWRCGRYSPMYEGDAKAAYDLGRADAQAAALEQTEGRA